MATMNIPQSALQFRNAEGGVDGSLSMTGYSGGVITNHFYWGDLIINLQGMRLTKDRYPILENHDVNKKIGFADRNQIEINGALRVVGGTVLSTEAGREFIRLSKSGYPFESSVYAKPTSIEKVPEGREVNINGLALRGPLTVWETSELREVSVVTFGWDSNTSASAMSEDVHKLSVTVKGDLDLDPDETWVRQMMKLAGGVEPEKAMLTDSEDDRAVAELLALAGQSGAV